MLGHKLQLGIIDWWLNGFEANALKLAKQGVDVLNGNLEMGLKGINR